MPTKSCWFQTGLPVLLSVVTKCQRTLNESIRNTVFSSVKAHVQLIHVQCSLTSLLQCQCQPNAELENSFSKVMLRCSLTSPKAKIQHEYPVLQIFSLPNIAPRKFATPLNRHSALYLRAFLRIFHTRKKMKSGYK